jgi:uncharacterized protein YbjT (DUF2867 family)
MAPRVLICGATGVFGQHLVHELDGKFDLVLGSRKLFDLRDPAALESAARGCFAVVCTAGPFQKLPPTLPHAAVRAGAHWIDIADPPSWILPLLADRELDAAARAKGLAVMTGQSSTPALSLSLLRHVAPSATAARITLYIGNRNAKGTAAVASALEAGLDDPVTVELPCGPRRAVRFASADTAISGIHIDFRVAFEWRLAQLALKIGRAPRLLATLAAPLSRFGSDAGGLLVEADGRRAFLWAEHHGQRLAILPAALALESLLESPPSGVISPTTSLPRLLARDRTHVRLQGDLPEK